EHDLKNEDVRYGDEADRPAVPEPECVQMLERDLQHAEHPAEALRNELARGLGGFSKSNCSFFIGDPIASANEPQREVRVLGKGVGSEAAGAEHGAPRPGPDSPRHYG